MDPTAQFQALLGHAPVVARRLGGLGYKAGLKGLGLGGVALHVAEELPGAYQQYQETGSVIDPARSIASSIMSSYAMGLVTKDEFERLLGSIGIGSSMTPAEYGGGDAYSP